MKRKVLSVLSCILMLSFVSIVNINTSDSVVNAKAKIKLNYSELYLEKGETETLKLKGTKKKPKWSSSNKKVATVNKKGVVKAKKVGKATITAKLGKKKYKCKIIVEDYDDYNDENCEVITARTPITTQAPATTQALITETITTTEEPVKTLDQKIHLPQLPTCVYDRITVYNSLLGYKKMSIKISIDNIELTNYSAIRYLPKLTITGQVNTADGLNNINDAQNFHFYVKVKKGDVVVDSSFITTPHIKLGEKFTIEQILYNIDENEEYTVTFEDND